MNEEAQEPVYTFIEYTVLEGDTVELWNLESGMRAEDSLEYKFRGLRIGDVTLADYGGPLELWQRQHVQED